MNINKLKSESGITFIELALTGIIIGATTIGLMMGFMSVTRNYQQDYLEGNLYRYGSLAMEEITRDLLAAQEVTVIHWAPGLDQLRLKVLDLDGQTRTITYSANAEEGLKVNQMPLPRYRGLGSPNTEAKFNFPSFGQYFDGSSHAQVKVDKFKLERWVQTNRTLQRLNDYLYTVKLRLSYKFKAADGSEVVRYKSFERQVFLTRAFI